MVRGSVIRDFARITFEWPEKTSVKASSSGNKITLQFDKSSNPSFGSLLAKLNPYISSASVAKDGKTIILTTNKNYKIRSFVSGNAAGVDVLGIDPKAARSKASPQKTAKAPEEKQKIKKQPVSKAKKDVAANQTAAKKPAPESKAKKLDIAKAKPEKKLHQVPEPKKPQPEMAAAPPAAAKPATPPAPAATAAIASTVKPAPPETKAPASENMKLIKGAPETQGSISLSLGITEDGVKLFFPFKERIAAAVFQRNGVVWVVFNSPLKIDHSAMAGNPTSMVKSVEQVPHENYSILRLTLSRETNLAASKGEDGHSWVVEMTKKLRRPGAPAKITINTTPPLKPHVVVSILENADPIPVTDPLVGDEILITPFFQPGQGIWPARRFVDFALLETAQGMAVQKIDDTTRIALTRSGIKIASVEGLQLSADLPMMEEEDPALYGEVSDTLFPYDRWKLKEGESFAQVRQGLMQQIIKSSAQEEKANLLRLRLAQLYITQGMLPEALGVLEYIASISPRFFVDQRLQALVAAIKFNMYRFVESAVDFSAPEISNNPEVKYWRDALGVISGAPEANFDFLAGDKEFFKKYPPVLRQRLALFAAETAINHRQYNTALQIFDRLNKDKQMSGINNYVSFMIAKISAETGQVAAAIKILEELMNKYEDPFVRVQSAFTHTVLQLRQGTISRDEAIRRLERLRYTWRNDNIELNILLMLSTLYHDKADYVPTLRTLREIEANFPSSAEALPARQKMAEIFKQLFADGLADKMEPIEALALFREFQQLVPIGKEGEDIYRKIADRLVGVDLLDEAIATLMQQVRYRLEGEDRSRVGTRIALIHLLNRQPEQAINILQTTGYGNNLPELSRARNQLTAQALSDLNKPEEALNMLEGDISTQAQELRLGIYWKQKDWSNVIGVAEEILGNRSNITESLTEKEARSLLKLSLAYLFERDNVQLQYLRDYFGPLMKGNALEKSFLYLTDNKGPVDHENFEQVTKDVSDIETFISSYRDKIADEGLSAAIQ